MKKSAPLYLLLLTLVLIFPAACKTPAEFETVSLEITPPEIQATETATVVATVRNVGGSEGVYNATLAVDGAEIEKKSVTVGPGASGQVTFSVMKDEAGTYEIAVGKLSSSLTVKPKLIAKEVELKYDDGTARDYISSCGGYLVDFTAPSTSFVVKRVRIIGAIFGQPSQENFEVEIWDTDKEVIYSAKFPITKFADAPVDIDIPNVEISNKFYVHVFTGTCRLQGIHIGADDSVANEHSTITTRAFGGVKEVESWESLFPSNVWFADKSKVNWMIRVVGTALVPEDTEEQTEAVTSETQPEQTPSTVSEQGKCQCPRGTSPSQLIHYPSSTNGWTRIPNITISAVENDHRIELTRQAVEFWNQQLAEIGSSFRFGTVTHTNVLIPDNYLIQASEAMLQGKSAPPVPSIVSTIPGDIIIALSDAIFVSWAQYPRTGKSIIAIRNCETSPLNLTNVPRNLIAHELGHALGLGHNNDVTKLMCGRPAECRPPDFHCDCEQFFPITDKEKELLLKIYPASWEPTQ
jgi:hypothetical protein